MLPERFRNPRFAGKANQRLQVRRRLDLLRSVTFLDAPITDLGRSEAGNSTYLPLVAVVVFPSGRQRGTKCAARSVLGEPSLSRSSFPGSAQVGVAA